MVCQTRPCQLCMKGYMHRRFKQLSQKLPNRRDARNPETLYFKPTWPIWLGCLDVDKRRRIQFKKTSRHKFQKPTEFMRFYSRFSPPLLSLSQSVCHLVYLSFLVLTEYHCSKGSEEKHIDARIVFRICRRGRFTRHKDLNAPTHLWLNWYPGSEHALFTPVFLSITSVYTTAVESAKPTVVSTTEEVFGTAGTANDVPLVVITACTAVLLLTTCCTTVSFSRLKPENQKHR